jgi:transposase-like protein
LHAAARLERDCRAREEQATQPRGDSCIRSQRESEASLEEKEEAAKIRRKRGSDVRKRYTASFKLRIVELVGTFKLQMGLKRGEQAKVADMAGIDPSLVTRWKQRLQVLEANARKNAGAKGAGNVGRVVFSGSSGPGAQFPAAEQLVLTRVEQARVRRLPVTGRMIKTWMKAAVKDTSPNALFTASPHW